jgi:hypothetical protein
MAAVNFMTSTGLRLNWPKKVCMHSLPCPTQYPDIYRGMLISNPSMIYLENEDFANPIFGIEVNTWILMQFLTGM